MKYLIKNKAVRASPILEKQAKNKKYSISGLYQKMGGDKSIPKKVKYIAYILSATVGVAIVTAGYLTVGLGYRFHSFIGFAFVASLLATAIMGQLESMRKTRIDDALPRLLDDIAESQEAGMTLFQALEASSKRKYGPISGELKKLAAELSWGVELEKAFKAFADRTNTDLSTRTTILIVEAIKLGGDLKATFKSTANFVRQMILLRNERDSRLRGHLMVIYVSSLIFLLMILILWYSFFLQMATQPTRFLRMSMSTGEIKTILFDLTIVVAIFGGLTAGKLTQGKTLTGLKHSLVLTFISTVVLTILL